MKKACIVVIALMILTLVSTSNAKTINLLADPGFEEISESRWASYGDAVYDTDTYRRGSKAGKAWVWDYGDGLFEQYVDVVAGETYKASVYIYSSSNDPIQGGAAAWIQIEWCTTDDIIISDAVKSTILTDANDTWQLFSTPAVIAPSAATKAKIKVIHLAPNGGAPGACYFDDAEFKVVD